MHNDVLSRCCSGALLLCKWLLTIVFSIPFISEKTSAGTNPADPAKVVRVAFEAADDGFDPVRTANAYSNWVINGIIEPLMTYDYLARPAKLIPNTIESMPEILEEGRVYVFHLKKGIYFAPDAAFKGKPRELTAQDYAYTLKRFLDPKNHSPSANFLSGKIVGMDELVAQANATGRFNYDAKVAGLQTPDPYTLRVTLKQADYNFLSILAYSAFGAVAREVIETYDGQTQSHPVGTGAYMLQKYMPHSKVILVANPNFRGYVWDFKSSGSLEDDQIVRDMKGKKMPQIGRVEINILEEEQSRWLAFQSKQLDFDKLPQTVAPTVLSGDRLKPEFIKQDIHLYRQVEPSLTYTFLNYKDPIIGGNSLEKIALRRAIIMSYSVDQEVSKMRMGQAVKSEMIIPQGVEGFDPTYRSSVGYDPELANKLLDHFGYKRGTDGYRTLPDGKPLVLKFAVASGTDKMIQSEIWKRGLDSIGIQSSFAVSNFADNLKAATLCQLMISPSSWSADFPEGENFVQLLYGPNAHQSNHACYASAAFDALYEKAIALPTGSARQPLYIQMNRQLEADSVWSVGVSPVRNWLIRPWVKGFKKHPILRADWQYLDIAPH
ncbi:ABC transporter substrate-binding protein [Aquirhabdus parva]|uniref:Heme-binding protein n=1 Tax=Aquirhabdus parva TaxID=2283318 RepID=A0A345P3N4_9GAMM|nr:heme-binding protein [Aquirhabdus parva]